MTSYTCSYSPDDNKIRLYASSRLDAETYERVKSAGFRWAPKQDLFFTTWAPRAEDIGIELAGEIEDEDTSLLDRAEERADRFEGYRDNRTADAESAHKAVAAIADNIPFGQPILVGHHSERRARKDAERIQNGMRKAVKAWETAEYWKDRAHCAIRHAKYKELPSVRARRIKTLEAELRKAQRETAQSATFIKMWRNLDTLKLTRAGEPVTDMRERAMFVANHDHISRPFPLADFPRDPPASQYEGAMGLWSALDGNVISPEQARDIAIPMHERGIAGRARWIAHYEGRLTYERAMLEDQGATDLLAPKPKPKHPPILNYRGEGGVIVTINRWRAGEFTSLRQVDMTAAEYARKPTDYKGTSVVEGSHRIRTAMIERCELVAVFITDSKTHVKPPAGPVKSDTREFHIPVFVPHEPETPSANAEAFSAMRETLRNGVKTVAVPQLFPTPPELARRVIAAADIQPGHRVLEPSAGTGALLEAIDPDEVGEIVAIEVNRDLCNRLWDQFPHVDTFCLDFLGCMKPGGHSLGPKGLFDRVVTNPPFADGDDIKHVTHALRFLKPGGRLVAIMSAGVTFRQDKATRAFRELVEEHGGTIEELPEDSFKSAGTGVRAVLVTIDA